MTFSRERFRCYKTLHKTLFEIRLLVGLTSRNLNLSNIRFRFAQTSLQSNVWKKQATRAHILRQAKSSEANRVQQSQTSDSECYKE